MATLRDVARIAGVSKMTVSNVLNGKNGQVSEETRVRVLAAVEHLGYEPNAAARALSRAESDIIAYVYPRPSEASASFDQPHDSLLIQSIELSISAAGKHLMVHSASDTATTAKKLSSWNVDGVIFFGVFGGETDTLARAHNVPMVFIDVYGPDNISVVGIDDFDGSYAVTKHILDAGHRNIAFVGPITDQPNPVEQRLLGYQKALSEVKGTTSAVFYSDTTLPLAEDLAESIINDPRRFTAAVTTADTIGVGLIHDLRNRGVSVPQQFSVTGFDNVYLAELVTPGLTTVHQDVALKGKLAADMLLDQIAHGTSVERKILSPQLRIRESVAAPAQVP